MLIRLRIFGIRRTIAKVVERRLLLSALSYSSSKPKSVVCEKLKGSRFSVLFPHEDQRDRWGGAEQEDRATTKRWMNKRSKPFAVGPIPNLVVILNVAYELVTCNIIGYWGTNGPLSVR
jgi:hypothetical protein